MMDIACSTNITAICLTMHSFFCFILLLFQDGEDRPPPSENHFATKPKLAPISRKEVSI